MSKYISAILASALGDDCAESVLQTKRGPLDAKKARNEGWAFLFAAVPDAMLLFLDEIDLRMLAMTHPRILGSIREWTDKCIRWVLRENYSWCESPLHLENHASSAIHGTMRRIKLLSELTERKFYIIGETGAIACFSVDRFTQAYNGHKNTSPWNVYETVQFQGLTRTLPQGLFLNGSLYIFGGENPRRSSEHRGGLESLDPLCLLEPKKRVALWGSIHRKPCTWRSSSGVSFMSVLKEKGCHRFNSIRHNGHIYLTGGRFLENNHPGGHPGANLKKNSDSVYRLNVESLKNVTDSGFKSAWYYEPHTALSASGGGEKKKRGDHPEKESQNDGNEVDEDVDRRYAVQGLPPMRTGRYGHASVIHNNRLIVAGGERHSQLENSVEFLDLAALEAYDKAPDTAPVPQWQSLPPLAAPGRFAFSLLVINNRVYAAGGSDTDSITIERLDEDSDSVTPGTPGTPGNGKWEIVARMPGTESDWGSFVVSFDHFIFYFGCYDPYESAYSASPHYNAYDLKSDRWLWNNADNASSSTTGNILSRLVRGKHASRANHEYNLPVPFSKFGCFVASVTDFTSCKGRSLLPCNQGDC